MATCCERRGGRFAAEEPELDRSDSNFKDENPIRKLSHANNHVGAELPFSPRCEDQQPPPVVLNVGPTYLASAQPNLEHSRGHAPSGLSAPPPPRVPPSQSHSAPRRYSATGGLLPPPLNASESSPLPHPLHTQSLHQSYRHRGSVHSVRSPAVELRPSMPTPSGSPPISGSVGTVPVSPGERQHSIDADAGISSLTPQRPSLPSTAAAMLGSRERSPPPTMPPPPHMQIGG